MGKYVFKKDKVCQSLHEAPRQEELIMYQKMKCGIFGEQMFYHQAAVWENWGSWAVSPMSKLGNYRSFRCCLCVRSETEKQLNPPLRYYPCADGCSRSLKRRKLWEITIPLNTITVAGTGVSSGVWWAKCRTVWGTHCVTLVHTCWKGKTLDFCCIVTMTSYSYLTTSWTSPCL